MRKNSKHRPFSCLRIARTVSGVSSQSFGRVQLKILGAGSWLIFSCLIGCSNTDLKGFEGTWKINLPATQASLSDARYMIPQTKAAAELSTALLARHRFQFEKDTLAFGVAKSPRTVTLTYRRSENKIRLVYGVSDSPHLLRLIETPTGLTMDFEGKSWYLVRDEDSAESIESN